MLANRSGTLPGNGSDMRISSIATAIIGLTLGFGGTAVIAAISGPAYIDADTGQLRPKDVPPTRLVTPRGVTKTLVVTATNTLTTTDVATATPSASAIPMAGTDNKIDVGWLPSSVLTGSGTANRIPRWASGTSLTNSALYDDGNFLYVSRVGGFGNVFDLYYFGSTGSYASSEFGLSSSRGSGFGAFANTQSGDILGRLRLRGSTATGFSEGAVIEALQYGTISGMYVPTKLTLHTWGASTENVGQLDLWPDGNITSTGRIGAANPVDCPAPMRCNGASTASLLQTATLTLSVATGTNSSTVARGDDGASAHTISVAGGLAIKTDTTTNTYVSASLDKNPTITYTNTSTATATATVTNTISVSPGLNLTVGTSTVTNTTAQIDQNPKVNLSAVLYCSGCQLSGTGTATATSMAISQSPEIIVTPASVGALPASSVSGTQNYLAKFGATGATLGDSKIYDNGSNILVTSSMDLQTGGTSLLGFNRPVSPTGYYQGIVFRTAGVDQFLFGQREIATNANSDFYIFSWAAGNVLRINRTAGDAQFYFPVAAPSFVINGSTSGAVTHGVAAATASYSLLDPSTAPGAGQAIVYPSGGGQGTWASPAVLTSSTPVTESPGTTGLVGAATDAAHSDHRHAMTAFGTTASTIAEGSDSRFTNARTPTAHASTHVTGGSDVIANVVAAGSSGLMTGSDKTKLNGLNPTDTSSVPKGAGFSAATPGGSASPSPADHRHHDTIDITWAPAGVFSSYGVTVMFTPSAGIVWEHPVLWGNIPTAAAAFAGISFHNSNASSVSCSWYLYSNTTPGTLGSAMISQSFTIPAGNSLQSTSATFTKPANAVSLLQVYGSCASSDVFMYALHFRITAGS
jgi:hypothetical protein